MSKRGGGGRWVRAVALGVVAAFTMAVAGCGVDASSDPDDVGDGLSGDSAGYGLDLPKPNQFHAPVSLVRGFLKASAGAGETARRASSCPSSPPAEVVSGSGLRRRTRT